MDLKTLKDIKKYYPMCLRRKGDILLMGSATEDKMKEYEKKELIDVNVLRPEVIERIKLTMKQFDLTDADIPKSVLWDTSDETASLVFFNDKNGQSTSVPGRIGVSTIGILMELFNITEADLNG